MVGGGANCFRINGSVLLGDGATGKLVPLSRPNRPAVGHRTSVLLNVQMAVVAMPSAQTLRLEVSHTGLPLLPNPLLGVDTNGN
ncbi:hypothetical protein PSAB6_450150 [Paraburkholderia sabiae]|nr:hypothetical protein PSAB6_450150 [Paraburkholderia sabiae]